MLWLNHSATGRFCGRKDCAYAGVLRPYATATAFRHGHFERIQHPRGARVQSALATWFRRLIFQWAHPSVEEATKRLHPRFATPLQRLPLARWRQGPVDTGATISVRGWAGLLFQINGFRAVINCPQRTGSAVPSEATALTGQPPDIGQLPPGFSGRTRIIAGRHGPRNTRHIAHKQAC